MLHSVERVTVAIRMCYCQCVTVTHSVGRVTANAIERVTVAMTRCFLEIFISRKMVWIGGLT